MGVQTVTNLRTTFQKKLIEDRDIILQANATIIGGFIDFLYLATIEYPLNKNYTD